MKQRIRLGMVGGGQGAFIGEVHRFAARLDDRFELVAGALSADADRAQQSARELGIADARSYESFEDMARVEAARDDGVQAVAIVTPNHLHFAPAKAMLEAGIHVICDKPLTGSYAEAQALAQVVEQSGAHFAVTYNYSGYPLVREARAMVAAGALGALRLVQVEYPQDWLATAIEAEGQKQAAWRTDPARAGAGGCIGDIGTHAFHLAGFVSGQQPESLLADLSSFVPGRVLDDNAHILLRYASGARGSLWASQVAAGEENALRLRLYGETGSLEWFQENPNKLLHRPLGQAMRTLTRAGATLRDDSGAITRIPAGHPEGFIEGFAALYSDFADLIEGGEAALLPTVADGVKGVRFVDAAVQSMAQGSTWVTL
ncbi:MAG: Gfo/Idh/MocA family oxidoreductase [Gammaproteobacteria bacterium]|nr:Gfo/Idh/MocA family oxidoreductase [Gammaproteobacteria bacterium]